MVATVATQGEQRLHLDTVPAGPLAEMRVDQRGGEGLVACRHRGVGRKNI